MNHPRTMNSDQSNWRQEVEALEEENQRAFLSGDLEQLNALWSDDLLVNSPINRVNEKQQILDLLKTGVIAHSSLQSHVEVSQQYGDLVVVMGSEVVTNSPDGPILHRRFTNVWRAEGGSWRLILRHANVIPDPLVTR
jgi:ketosteroid isomerase-like protein